MSELPFSAFEEVSDGVVTAVPESQWSSEHHRFLEELKDQLPFSYRMERQEPQNWNAIWESGFREITVDDFCMIRAPFHAPSIQCRYEIIIEPRMAFGTGHHETTRLMIRSMRPPPIEGNRVLDFGSGSGILAILAAKLGARQIWAIEYDDQAFVNLLENITFNQADNIVSRCQDHLSDFEDQSFDVILANITRNVLIEHTSDLFRILSDGGYLVVSGFLQKDHELIVTNFTQAGLSSYDYKEENDWIAHTFRK